MYPQSIFLGKISKKISYVHLKVLILTALKMHLFEMISSNYLEVTTEMRIQNRFQNGHCTFIMPVMHNAQKRLG